MVEVRVKESCFLLKALCVDDGVGGDVAALVMLVNLVGVALALKFVCVCVCLF